MRINLSETYNIIIESRKTEEQAVNIFRKNNISDEDMNHYLDEIKNIDTSENKKNIAPIAYFMVTDNPNENELKTIFSSYQELLDKKRINNLTYTKKGIMIDNELIPSFLKFAEKIHAVEAKYKNKEASTIDVKTLDDIEPLYSSNNIEIYDGQNREKCINYGAGALSGDKLPFCIGDKSLANNMYHKYRLGNESTFYYVLDKNKSNTDPLHVVVIDNKGDKVELTDMNNSTGDIAEFGGDYNAYLNYLKENGIPIEKIVNVKLSDEEKVTKNKAMNQIRDLNTFIDLVQNHYDDAQRYLEFGNTLTNEQLNYLINV